MQTSPLCIKHMAQLWHHSESMAWNILVCLRTQEIEWETLLIRRDDCCTLASLNTQLWEQNQGGWAVPPSLTLTEQIQSYQAVTAQDNPKFENGHSKRAREMSRYVAMWFIFTEIMALFHPGDAALASPPLCHPTWTSLSTHCWRGSNTKLHFQSKNYSSWPDSCYSCYCS